MIVELIGLPGVGKSTVSKTLCSCSQQVQLARTPYFRNPGDIPFFVQNTLRVAPLLRSIPLGTGYGLVGLRDLVLMVILTGWNKKLQRQAANGCPVLLLDEGPVCYLTRLRAWGSFALKTGAAKQWWDTMYRQWADTLDQLIELDTSNEILIERIRKRMAWQEVKSMSDTEARAYMQNLRATQEYVVAEISRQAKSPDFAYFDTRLNSPAQISQEIAALLKL